MSASVIGNISLFIFLAALLSLYIFEYKKIKTWKHCGYVLIKTIALYFGAFVILAFLTLMFNPSDSSHGAALLFPLMFKGGAVVIAAAVFWPARVALTKK